MSSNSGSNGTCSLSWYLSYDDSRACAEGGAIALNNCMLIANSRQSTYLTYRHSLDLQAKNKAVELSWEDTFTGPRHAGEWTSSCKSTWHVTLP